MKIQGWKRVQSDALESRSLTRGRAATWTVDRAG